MFVAILFQQFIRVAYQVFLWGDELNISCSGETTYSEVISREHLIIGRKQEWGGYCKITIKPSLLWGDASYIVFSSFYDEKLKQRLDRLLDRAILDYFHGIVLIF